MIRSGPSRRGTTQWSRQYTGGPRYIEVSSDASVLVVEDSLTRQIRFRNWLSSSVKIVSSVQAAINELETMKYDWIFLDRDLGFGNFGENLADHLVSTAFAGRVICHSANPFGVELICSRLASGNIQCEAVPFEILGVVRVPVS